MAINSTNSAPITGQGTNGYVGAGGIYVPSSAASPISADTLGKGSQPVTVPPAAPSTSTAPSVSAPQGTTTDANGNAAVTPLATDSSSDTQDYIRKSLASLGSELGTKGAVTTQLNTDSDIAGKTTQAANDYNAYNQAQLALNQKVESMKESNPDGEFGGARAAEIDRVQREGNANLANLAVIAQSSQGLLTAAQKTITDKINAQFQPINDQIDFLTKFASVNDNDLTDSQKEALTIKADQQKTDSASVQTATADIHKTLLANGAPASAYSAVDAITDKYVNGQISATDAQSQMYAAASQYGVTNLTGGINNANLPTVQLNGDGVPDTASQTAFLSSLPSDVSTLVKGLADYSVNPSTFATRLLKGAPGMTRADAIALTKQYDPTYSETQYASRQALQTNFESGKYSQNINSLNTAVGHLDDLTSTSASLGNVGFTPVNYVKNGAKSLFGFGGDIKSAGLNVNASTGELASTFKGGGASDTEIKSLGTVGTNSSPSDFKGYIQTGINLLGSRLQALTDTYTSGMGKPPASSFLSPTNMATLSDLKNQGYDVQIKGVYFTDPVAYSNSSSDNATALTSVRTAHPELSPAQATQLAQYLQENGQL